MKQFREECVSLEAFYWEMTENYLGVALIQPGDAVIIEWSGFG